MVKNMFQDEIQNEENEKEVVLDIYGIAKQLVCDDLSDEELEHILRKLSKEFGIEVLLKLNFVLNEFGDQIECSE